MIERFSGGEGGGGTSKFESGDSVAAEWLGGRNEKCRQIE